MREHRTISIFALFVVLPAAAFLTYAQGCVVPRSETDDGSNPVQSDWDIDFDTAAESTRVATVIESIGGTIVVVSGNKDTGGNVQAITAVLGSTADGQTFMALISQDAPTELIFSDERLQVTATSEDEFTIAWPVEPPLDSAQTLPAESTIRFAMGESETLQTLLAESTACPQDSACSRMNASGLQVIYELARLHYLYSHLADSCVGDDEEAPEEELLDSRVCDAAEAVADELALVADVVIADNSDLPAEIRTLCFSGDCTSDDEPPEGNANETEDNVNDNADDGDEGEPASASLNGCWHIEVIYDDGNPRSQPLIYEIEDDHVKTTWYEDGFGLINENLRFPPLGGINVSLMSEGFGNLRQSVTSNAGQTLFAVSLNYDGLQLIDGELVTTHEFHDGITDVIITLDGTGADTFVGTWEESYVLQGPLETGDPEADELSAGGSAYGESIPCPNPFDEDVISQEDQPDF